MAKAALFLAIGALGTFLSALPILAQTGSLSASPNPCTIPSGKSTCTSTLTWSAQNTSAVQVWVSHNGAAKTNFASSGPGSHSQNASWIQSSPSHTYTFYLYNYSSGSRGALLSSVTVTGKKSTPLPTATFSVSPTTIERGQSATLRWTTTNATSAAINRSIGAVTPVASGSRSVSPTSTTTYTLTVTGPGGTLTPKPTATVTVTEPPSGSISASPNPCKIPSGKSTCTTTLSWSATGTSGLLVRVSRNGGSSKVVSSSGVSGSTSPSWIKAAPANTYTFYLYDYAGRVQGRLLDSVTVTGKKSTPPPTATFSVSPTTIENGQSATLRWTTTNATSVTINRSIGAVSPVASGSHSVSPTSTTTYTLTVTGPGGTLTPKPTATVTVTEPESSGTISASPNPCTIPSGKSTCTSTIKWSSQNTSSVQVWVSHNGAAKTNFATSGSGTHTEDATWIREAPDHTYTFYLYDYSNGSRGALLRSVTVTGKKPTPLPKATFAASPTTIERGQSATLSWTTTDATSVSIEQDIGQDIGVVSPVASGSRSVSPTSTTTYTLTVTSAGGTLTLTPKPTVTVTVTEPPSGSISASPNPCTIPSGKSTCTTALSWDSQNTSSVQVWVSHNGAAKTNVATSGSGTHTKDASWIQAAPDHTYTFYLYDYSSESRGALLGSVTVTGKKTTLLPTATFSASPTTIERGQSATLSWTTTNANSVTINQSIGSVIPVARGSRSVSPTSTTTYTLTATGEGGTLTPKPTVTVTVTEPTSSGSISASPSPCTVYHSQTSCTVTVTWFSQNVSLVRVYRSVNGGLETKFAQSVGGGGSQNPQSMEATIESGNRYTFSLYDYSNESLGETAMSATEVASQSSIRCPLSR